jgi:hypothetical protein
MEYDFGYRAGIFKEAMGARNRGGRGLSYRPARLRWRTSFLGIDSGALYTFKNTGSDVFILRYQNNDMVGFRRYLYLGCEY